MPIPRLTDSQRSHVRRLTRAFDHHEPCYAPDLDLRVHQDVRSSGPAIRSDLHGGTWILSRYRDVAAASASLTEPREPGAPSATPPEHAAFEGMMEPPFLPSRESKLLAEVRRLTRRLLAPVVARGYGDLVTELAVPLPLAVMALAVGFSEDAQARIGQLAGGNTARTHASEAARGFWPAFTHLCDRELRRARRDPDRGYLSVLAGSPIDGRTPTDHELHVRLVAFAIAGHQTSMNTLVHLLWQLADRPDLQQRLRTDPASIPAAVTEALRLWTPLDQGIRVTTRQLEIQDGTVPAGSRVILLTGAANRDPEVFPDPDAFRLDRGPAGRLVIGGGAQVSVGAHLARAGFTAVLQELARHPDYKPLQPSCAHLGSGYRHTCPDRLPVYFAGADPDPEPAPQRRLSA